MMEIKREQNENCVWVELWKFSKAKILLLEIVQLVWWKFLITFFMGWCVYCGVRGRGWEEFTLKPHWNWKYFQNYLRGRWKCFVQIIKSDFKRNEIHQSEKLQTSFQFSTFWKHILQTNWVENFFFTWF